MVPVKSDYQRGVFSVFDLGSARFIDLMDMDPKEGQRSNEVFLTIKWRGSRKDKHGYIIVTDEMNAVFDTLFRSNPQNRSIHFYEWDDCFNAVFEDGIYISSAKFAVDKNEFEEWVRYTEEEQSILTHGFRAEQICNRCGESFYLRYFPNASYIYETECSCTDEDDSGAGFYPAEGVPSISEWLADRAARSAQRQKRKEIHDKVNGFRYRLKSDPAGMDLGDIDFLCDAYETHLIRNN